MRAIDPRLQSGRPGQRMKAMPVTALLLAGSLSASGAVRADTAASARSDIGATLQEVVVTATKQRQSIDKVPISITALTQDQMDRAGIRSVDDVVRQTPGVDFSRSPFGGGLGSTIAMRGILSTTGASTTGVYIDDIPIQSRANQENFIGDAFPEVFDLERVEVLRGPQGTLWGAGAEGGAIRFITPAAGLTTYSGYARTEVSETKNGSPSYEAGAAVGGPIVDNTLGFRISAWYRRDGGYVDRRNYETGVVDQNSNWQNSYVVHAALAWRPTESVKVTPSLFYQDAHLNDTGSIWESLSNPSAGALVNGHVLQQPTTDKFYLPGLKVEVALGGVDLTSISSYFYRNEAELADDTNFESVIWTGLPYPVLPGQNAPSYIGTAQNIISQEIRLQSHDPDARLRWTAGLFYSDAREKDYNEVEDLYLNDLIEQAFGLSLEQFFGIGLADGKYTFVGTTLSYDKQLAGFGQIDYRIWRSLTLTAGLRVARTQFDFVQDYAGPVNYSGSGPASRTITGSEKESPVTPKVGLSYSVTPRALVYFSAGEGYRIGGANSPVPLNPACKANLAELGLSSSPLEYRSDSTWSYEVGFKDRGFDDRLLVEASAFHINWRDIQQYVGLPSCGGIGFVANLGNAVSNGFDLQVKARPIPQLSLSAAVGYTDATYANTVGSNGTIIVNKGDTVGSPPTGVSPWSVDGSIQYDFEHIAGHDVYIRADDSYRSHQSGRSANLDDPRALGFDPNIPFDPATNELDVRLGTLVGGADISVFANNVLNEQPLLQRTHDIPGSPLYYDLTMRPLTAGVTVSYRY
jgi:iron complex outermembrane receptor protein